MPRCPSKCIVILKADTADDFDQRMRDLEIDLASCDQDPTAPDREQWQMARLLRALSCKRQLPMPVQLYKREKPDFLLEAGNFRIGIETTEAINPDYVRAQAHPAAAEDGTVIDPSLFKWGTEARPNSQLREEIGRRQLSGEGWIGDEAEQEFGQSVNDVVRSKDKKLQRLYTRYESNRLLIYYNQPTPLQDVDKARVYAADCLVGYWNKCSFDTVYVLKHNCILYFTRAASGILHEFPRSYKPHGIDKVTWSRLGTIEKIYLKLLEDEFEIMQMDMSGDPELESAHAREGGEDLQLARQEWLELRARYLSEHDWICLLQPPEQVRLRTASEVATCPSTLALFRGSVLEHVFCGVAKTIGDSSAIEASLFHAAFAIDRLEYKAPVIAILDYLSAFENATHWQRDSRCCSQILESLQQKR